MLENVLSFLNRAFNNPQPGVIHVFGQKMLGVSSSWNAIKTIYTTSIHESLICVKKRRGFRLDVCERENCFNITNGYIYNHLGKLNRIQGNVTFWLDFYPTLLGYLVPGGGGGRYGVYGPYYTMFFARYNVFRPLFGSDVRAWGPKLHVLDILRYVNRTDPSLCFERDTL